MAIILNGTTGITNDGGYTGDGISFADTTPSNTLVTTTGGSVGVGTVTSTAYANYVNNTSFKLVSSVSDSSTSAGSNIGQLAIDNLDTTANNYSKLAFTTSDGGNRVVASGIYTQVTARTSGNFVSSNMQFWTGTTGGPPEERMRLDSSGNFLVGTTTVPFSGTANTIVSASSGVHQFQLRNTGSTAGRAWRICADTSNTFYILNQDVAGVSITNGGTSWNAVSDERLKTDLQPITNAFEKVASLRAVTGRYKTDEEGKSRAFLIAQDVEAVLPQAVSKSKLINNENDDAEYLNVSYTDVIPLLVAAIKEQKAIITDLTTRLEVLEAK